VLPTPNLDVRSAFAGVRRKRSCRSFGAPTLTHLGTAAPSMFPDAFQDTCPVVWSVQTTAAEVRCGDCWARLIEGHVVPKRVVCTFPRRSRLYLITIQDVQYGTEVRAGSSGYRLPTPSGNVAKKQPRSSEASLPSHLAKSMTYDPAAVHRVVSRFSQ
jgi:hypothetical protein